MTATTTPKRTGSSDSLLRFALRADAIMSGVIGAVNVALAGWVAEISGTTRGLEYAMGAFFVAYGVVVYTLAARPSVRRIGIVVAIGNLLYTIGSVVFAIADFYPLTTTGVVLTLIAGVYTLVFAELQYQGWRRIRR